MFDYVEFPVLPVVKTHVIINSVLGLLAVVIVGLRFVARTLAGAGLWWDDYLVLLALPQGIVMIIIEGLWAPMGIGYNVSEVLPNLVTLLKMLIAYEIIYSTSMSFIKLSVLFFYLRVFVNHSLRTATKAAIVLVCLWCAGNFLQVFLICQPFLRVYDPTVPGVCGDHIASFIAIGAYNIITDVIIMILPMPTLWSLNMSTMAKFSLTCVLLAVLAVSVIGSVRIVFLTRVELTNITRTTIWTIFWSATEPALAIFCVSLPMLGGSLWSRCSSRRSASRLHQQFSPGNGTKPSAAFCKLKNQNSHDSHIGLKNMYASNQQVHYEFTAVAMPEPNRSLPIHRERGSGSEVALAAEERYSGHSPDATVRVQTKWNVSHG